MNGDLPNGRILPDINAKGYNLDLKYGRPVHAEQNLNVSSTLELDLNLSEI
jgi:hypothetical protein